jgi:integrase
MESKPTQDTSYDNSSDLSKLVNDDTLSVSEISERLWCMRKTQIIERKYKNKIKERKDGRQFYIYMNGQQYTSSTYKGLINLLYEKDYGRERASLADLYPEWIIWRRDFSPVCDKTLKENVHNWNHYLENEPITQKPLVEVTAKDLVQLFRKWTKNRDMTRKQFNNVKSLLNGIYYYAVEEGIVPHNLAKDINCKQFPFKPVNNSDDVFTKEERTKLLDYLSSNNDIYSLAIQLDFQLVLRIGELLALRWTDIKNGNIHIQAQLLTERKVNDDLTFEKREHVTVNYVKGYADQGYRFQPLTDEALRILELIREKNPDGEFILMSDGRQLNANSFNRWLKRYCDECGIVPRSSHKIRFCVASMLYDSGVPLTVLQQLLGHTTTAMTLHYLRRVTPSSDTVRLMNEALS